MNSPTEEIKSMLDLVELIGSYVKIQKAGINYKANCPFHGEKTPSFFVSPTRQMWHCFGCSRGGDAFQFIMEIEGHDFPEALKFLAQRTGVELKREDPRISSQRNRLFDLCEEATKIFEQSLSLTPSVLAYLKKRGLTEETIKEFRVGFSLQSWDYLLNALQRKGFKPSEIVAAGLAINRESTSGQRPPAGGSASSLRQSASGGWYDRFRSRIMFPISDASGRIVGFGGRVFEEEGVKSFSAKATDGQAKYVNTPQTLLYDKSKVLYGFDRAKQEIRVKNQAVIVEGYMDCLMSHQAGVKNTIAVSGTALTPDQLKIIKRLCNTIVSSFDADSAGESATKRSLALAGEYEFECKVAVIPSGKDPADAVFDSPQSWTDAIEHARPVVDFYFEKAFRDYDAATASGKKGAASMIMPWVSKLANEIEKSHWIKELAKRLGVSESAIEAELRKDPLKSVLPRDEKNEFAEKVKSRRELLEERVLSLLPILKPETVGNLFVGNYLEFVSPARHKIFAVLSDSQVASDTEIVSPELLKELELFRFRGEVLSQSLPDPHAEFLLCKKELERMSIKEKLQELGGQIAQKERSGDRDLGGLLQEFQSLSGRLKITE